MFISLSGTQCFTLVGVALLFIIVMAGLASFYSDNDDTVPADIASNIVQGKGPCTYTLYISLPFPNMNLYT